MREGYSILICTVCVCVCMHVSVHVHVHVCACACVRVRVHVCVCVSLATLEAVLIYIGQQMVYYLSLKTQILQIGSFDSETAAALYHTSYGHAHLLKFKVHFKGN